MAYALFVDASGSRYGGAHLTFCYRGEGRPVERRGISFLIRPLPYQGIVVPTAAQLELATMLEGLTMAIPWVRGLPPRGLPGGAAARPEDRLFVYNDNLPVVEYAVLAERMTYQEMHADGAEHLWPLVEGVGQATRFFREALGCVVIIMQPDGGRRASGMILADALAHQANPFTPRRGLPGGVDAAPNVRANSWILRRLGEAIRTAESMIYHQRGLRLDRL